MKIYLAAWYGRRKEMHEIAKQLRWKGYTVVSHWVDGYHDSIVMDDLHRSELAIEDYRNLMEADVIVSFSRNPDDLEESRYWGGKHVEFGIALALKKRLIVIGLKENIFHYFPGVENYESIWEAFR